MYMQMYMYICIWRFLICRMISKTCLSAQHRGDFCCYNVLGHAMHAAWSMHEYPYKVGRPSCVN